MPRALAPLYQAGHTQHFSKVFVDGGTVYAEFD